MEFAKKKELGQLLQIGPNSTQLNVRVPQALYKALMRNAEKEGITIPEIVRNYLTLLSFNTMLDDALSNVLEKGVEENTENEGEVSPESLKERIDFIDAYFDKFAEFFAANKKQESQIMETKKKFDEVKKNLSAELLDMLKSTKKKLGV